jgi:hypothetical protein
MYTNGRLSTYMMYNRNKWTEAFICRQATPSNFRTNNDKRRYIHAR